MKSARGVSPPLPLCIVLAALFPLVLGGCGYTTASSLDEKFQTIFVSAFENGSREYGLQAPLTTAIIRKFVADGRLRPTNRQEADLLMEGVILGYNLEGLIFDRDDEVTQFLVLVRAGVRLTDLHTGEVLWENKEMVGESTFLTVPTTRSSNRLRGNTGTFVPTVRSFSSEEENRAASESLEQLASDIFYLTIEPW